MKKLVLEAVSRPTTHAQDSRVEPDSFSRSIYLFFVQVRLLLNRAYNSRITAVIILYIYIYEYRLFMFGYGLIFYNVIYWFHSTVF